jgi:hypothetical protein
MGVLDLSKQDRTDTNLEQALEAPRLWKSEFLYYHISQTQEEGTQMV